MKNLKWRVFIVLSVMALCSYKIINDPINLGIDLQGGTHMTLQVMTDELSDMQKIDAIDRTVEILRNRINEFNVAETVIRPGNNERIIVQIPGIETKDAERIKNIIRTQAYLEFRLVDDNPDAL